MSQDVTKAISAQSKVLEDLAKSIAAMKNISIDTSGFVSQQSLESSFKTSLADTNNILKQHTGFLRRIAECCEEGNKKQQSTKSSPATTSTSQQSKVTEKMSQAASKAMSGVTKSVGSMFSKVSGSMKSIIPGIKGFTSKIKGMSSIFKVFAKRIPIVGTAITILGPIFSGMNKIFMTTIQYAKSLTEGLLSLTYKISTEAIKTGNAIRTNITETIGNAIEAVKESFDLDSSIGKGFSDIDERAKSFYLTSMDITNDFTKLFGVGSSAVTQYINTLQTSFNDMGQFADVIAGSITKTDESALSFIKATRILGLAGDDLKFFAMESIKNLKPISETLDGVIVAVKETSKTFGLDFKKLSKNFFTLRKDITNFGHLSDQELSRTAARLTQLGVTGEAAVAVFNKMDTFESAAQSAALLSQAFGMNIDALQMIKAENPLEIVEMFRESMFMTGRAFDDLNRHEKALMAQHTGLNAEQLNMIMNFRSMGMAFEEIQEQIKSSDPTEQQRKNIESMEGSLKQLRNVIAGTDIFSDFISGLKTSIVYGTEFGNRLENASKMAEKFRMAGLKLSETTKKNLNNILKPLTDSLDEMFGSKGKKGIFNAENFSIMFDEFAADYGKLFAQAFDKKTDLSAVQKSFTKRLSETFSSEKLLSGNNMGSQLLLVGGKFVGQILRGFAAIGPGLIEVIANAFIGITNWLTNNDESMFGASIKKNLMKLFDLDENDMNAVIEGLGKIFDTITAKILPSLVTLYGIIQAKIAGLAVDLLSEVTSGIFNRIVSGLSTITNSISNIIPGASFAYNYLFGDEPSKKEVQAPVTTQNANDAISDALSGTSKAIFQRGSSGISITRLSAADQITAGMPGGPIVDAIRYSGNVTAGLADMLVSNLNEYQSNRGTDTSSQRPVEVVLKLDSEVVTKVLLNNDLIGKAGRLEYTNGSTRLTSQAQVNPTGGSTEASSLG